ncbi:MAG TPA: glycosyltransferase family 4 protein [Candidatus Binataceae bacterium]|nr:glycosyltransferase family 4 protein [Candidatus Binataceae bacterium]
MGSWSPVEAPTPAAAMRAAPALSVAGVDPECNFAGGETQVLGLTLELRAMGHRAELLCDPAGELWRRAQAAGVVCRPLPIRNALDLAAALALRRRLRDGRYDVVHFHTSRAHALAPWVRGLARAAVVTRRMDYVPNRLFAPWLYGRHAVDGVAAISAAVADALARAIGARERITVIPSGVDCAHFRPPSADERAAARAALGLGDADLAVGTVGALVPRKGHRYLVEAMALLGRGSGAPQRRVVAIIAGGGSLRDPLAAEIRRLGLGDAVRMLGRVDDARAILWALDVFAMPSLSEGLGVALLEAMACGLPSVASRVGGIVDTVDDGRTGMLVAPADAPALAGALAHLSAEAAALAAMGAAARAMAVERFSMASMARRTVELYRACLQTGASA